MNPIASIGPTQTPYHVAKAYGVNRAQPVEPVKRAVVQDIAVDTPRAPRTPQLNKLIAAKVPGGIDFNTQSAPLAKALKSPATYTIHASDAERNFAATGVLAGRSLDINA